MEGGIFLLGLSVSYILLINGIFYQDLSLVVFSIVVTGALHMGEQPLISKHEIRLHKAFGASNSNIWSLIVSQSAVKALIITLLSLALSGANSFDEILPLSTLFSLRNLWILPAVMSLFIILISLFHFRLFTKTNPSFSDGK